METIIFPASAGRAGKAVQNDSRRKTVRNSLRSGRNRWKHLCALRARPASSEKRRSTGSGRTNDQRGSCKQILRGGHWTYLRICRSGIKEFCESRRLTGRLFSHSLPLVAPIRLSMPPAGFWSDSIIATRAVSGQLTAFFISESVELCPLYFSADFRIIFTICTCIGFFPCCRGKSPYPRQHSLFFMQVQIPQNQRNKAIFIIAISCINHWLSTNSMALYAL